MTFTKKALCFLMTAFTCAGSCTLVAQDMETQVEDIFKKLTLEEKVKLCYGRSWMEAGEVPRLGIGPLKMADGPQGVTRHKEPAGLPCGISLSCTWNEEAAYEYGKMLGSETLGVGRHVILGPGVNLMRTPLNGRNFEYYGEDPILAGKIACAYIKGVQSLDVAATIKHLAANNQENHRWLSSSNVDERTLRELYFVPFEMSVKDAGVWLIMSCYNRLNGVFGAENRWLQHDVAKVEWGFDGVMVSDWNAVHDGKKAALGGLDLEMGSGHFAKNDTLLNMAKSGELPMNELDDKVRRMLRLMVRTHAINPELQKKGENNTTVHQEKIRELGAEGMVLLKNSTNILPLDAGKIRKLLVVGPNADKEHRGAGGSGGVMSPYEITPLQGLRNVLGDKVTYIAGYTFEGAIAFPGRYLVTAEGEEGVMGEYFDNPNLEGAPVVTGVSKAIDFKWGSAMFGLPSDPKMPTNNLSARFTGKVKAPVSGKVKLGVSADDGVRLWLNDKLIIDQWKKGIHNKLEEVELTEGQLYDLKVEYFDAGGKAHLTLVWEDPRQDRERAYAEAKDADAVIFVGGTNHSYDTEGGWGESAHDIPNLELIGPQAELISKLAEINKNTIVVLVNGSVVRMEQWIDSVPAVLEAWYAGQEAGNSIADILFGKVNPSGKLTATFGKELKDYACHALGLYPGKLGPLSADPHTDYKEGLFIGYRWFDAKEIEPRFPFGYGLSYTTFKLEAPRVSAKEFKLTDTLRVSLEVTNTGKVAGAEVVQLYLTDKESSVTRPSQELKAFKKVFLQPGETKEVTMELKERDFSFWHPDTKTWTAEPGEFEIRIGTSSRHIDHKQTVRLVK